MFLYTRKSSDPLPVLTFFVFAVLGAIIFPFLTTTSPTSTQFQLESLNLIQDRDGHRPSHNQPRSQSSVEGNRIRIHDTRDHIRFPSCSSSGAIPACCPNSSASKLLAQDPSNLSVSLSNSTDLVIVFTFGNKTVPPSYNPNHLIADQWNPVIFLAFHCMTQQQSRRVSIPSFRRIPHMQECLASLYKANRDWQDKFRTHGIGTLVPEARILSKDHDDHDDISKCSAAHSFSPSLTYLTALWLAGPHGSLAEFEERNELKSLSQQSTNDILKWEVRFDLRWEFRSHLAMKPQSGGGQAMRRAFGMARDTVYRSILPPHSPTTTNTTDSSTCRIVLYDRSQESGHSRPWQDSHVVLQELQALFPQSSIMLLPFLPPRFTDQVLLFSSLDVFIGVHGGWAPNVMFLAPPTSSKIVFETPKDCNEPEKERKWMRRLRNVVDFELVDVGCDKGSEEGSQLLYKTAFPVIVERLERGGRCR